MQPLSIASPNTGAGIVWKTTTGGPQGRVPGSACVVFNFERGDGMVVSRWMSLN